MPTQVGSKRLDIPSPSGCVFVRASGGNWTISGHSGLVYLWIRVSVAGSGILLIQSGWESVTYGRTHRGLKTELHWYKLSNLAITPCESR